MVAVRQKRFAPVDLAADVEKALPMSTRKGSSRFHFRHGFVKLAAVSLGWALLAFADAAHAQRKADDAATVLDQMRQVAGRPGVRRGA